MESSTNEFKVGDLVIVKYVASSPYVQEGAVLQLFQRGNDKDVWRAYRFLQADEMIFIHWHALELYWRPDA
jgi:hypothetical protein